MHGVISGIGWGGTGIVSRAHDAHYAYEISYVAQWPRHGGGKFLVAYYHGGPPPPVAVLQADRRLGAMNPSRFAERYGDRLAGAPTLALKGAYVSFNRRGLRPDGTIGAKYLTTEVDALTATGSRESARRHCPGRRRLFASGPRCGVPNSTASGVSRTAQRAAGVAR